MNKKPLILVGGGGHCKSCIDIIEAENKYEIKGIIDKKNKIGESILGYSIMGCDDELELLTKNYKYFLVTIGQIKDVMPRHNLYKRIKSYGVDLATVISPDAVVSKHATIGEGTVIAHNVLINAGAIIGNNCIINSAAVIEHDVVIQGHCHISTGCIVNASSVIQECSFVGSNSIIFNNVTIGDNIIVGAGSVVSKSINDAGTYLGNTLRKIK